MLTLNSAAFFNFRALPLTAAARNRLGAIAESQIQHPHQRCELLKIILATAYDPQRGLYVPLSDTAELAGYVTKDIENLPVAVSPLVGWRQTLFNNALMLPVPGSPMPSSRSTNAGFMIVTHEFDCETKAQFEETLAWSTDSGPFGKLDKELQKYRDYRGYCIVFAGRRSIHFHFLFNTRHLKNAPFDADFEQRLAHQQIYAAIMPKVHLIYWYLIDSLIETILTPSLKSDKQLRSIFQWRRTPWGTRVLSEPSEILELPAGTAVPQLVIKEKIRTKAAMGSDAWIVDAEFSAATPLNGASARHRSSTQSSANIDNDSMFAEADRSFRDEWGEYPKLGSIQQDKGEWLFKFFNHQTDTRPDTYVRGDYRRLDLVGTQSLSQSYFVPDHMTANQFGDHLALLCGQPTLETSTEPAEAQSPDANTATPDTSLPDPPISLLKRMATDIEKDWPLPMRGLPTSQVMDEYRRKLVSVIFHYRMFSSDSIILSGEGIGKTTSLFTITAEEAFDTALDHYGHDDHQRFSVFAFRSLEQAVAKADEAAARTGRKVVVIQSFWRNYQDACKAENVQVISREHFPDRSIDGILRRILYEQPAVFARLEDMRSKIWPTHHRGKLDAGLTLIFTSHPTASSWFHSQTTRIWHHPEFEPFMDVREQQALRNTFVFAKVVYDEPEIDEVLHVIPESVFQHLEQQHASVNWKDRSNRQQRDLFKQAVADGVLGGQKLEFETYAELMRVQLDKLERVAVDCDAIPFGHDNITTADGGRTGMYRAMHGKTFHLGAKQWLAHAGTNWTFLTTERLVTDVIEKLYDKMKKSLIPLRLDNMTDIYPIKIPVFIDLRAAADKPGVPKVSAIAREIMNSNSNAVVVSDGVDETVGAMTFQKMKGRNDLADKDVYIILTSLAVEVYARLAVIGQWLGIPDIVGLHYQGLINQAVGRNTGFRQRDGTKTVVICSQRLWEPVISKLNLSHPRVLLYKDHQRPW